MRKLIPNVSPEWISKLKSQLKSSTYCRSQEDLQSVEGIQQEGNDSYRNSKAIHQKTFVSATKMNHFSGFQCMTTSTEGVSFISPRNMERAGEFEIAEEYGHYGSMQSEENEQLHQHKGSNRSSAYINIQNFEEEEPPQPLT